MFRPENSVMYMSFYISTALETLPDIKMRPENIELILMTKGHSPLPFLPILKATTQKLKAIAIFIKVIGFCVLMNGHYKLLL